MLSFILLERVFHYHECYRVSLEKVHIYSFRNIITCTRFGFISNFQIICLTILDVTSVQIVLINCMLNVPWSYINLENEIRVTKKSEVM